MIVEYAKVLACCDQEHSEDIEQIHLGVEDFIKARTGHDFEETDYVEFCTAVGNKIFLEHYPVKTNGIAEIATLTSGVKIKNTSTDSRNAYVSVASDSLALTVIGGDNAMTATLTFSDYATLTLLIAAINAQAKGWDAALYDADYASYPSASLREVQNFFCGASRGVAPTYSYLEMLDTPYGEYDCDEDTGVVTRWSGWASGFRKIVAKYTAYATVPENITTAVLEAVQFMVQQKEDGALGVTSYTLGHSSVKYEDILPGRVLAMIDLHTKVM